MNKQRDYTKDLAEIRSMMERSSKFLSLSGWAGVLAGFYAVAGAYAASNFFSFNPDNFQYSINSTGDTVAGLPPVIATAVVVLLMSIGTAIILSGYKAKTINETIWNPTSRRMITAISFPLFSGGILILLMISQGFAGLAAPLTLIFYGLGLISASNFTYKEVRSFGMLMIILGLLSCYFIEYSIWMWAFGFGILHMVYGIYLYVKYER